MSRKIFVYIWEYLVKEEFRSEFEKIYGPDGDWVRLFKKANGYVSTDFYQDISDTNRFITVDSWDTKKDRDNFREKFSKEFEFLDEQCERFTEEEKFIGDFNHYSN